MDDKEPCGRSTADALGEARLNLARRGPHGQVLGPLGATELALGESFARFDQHTFVGELPPGWEVEL